MAKSVCIICEKEKGGEPILDGHVIPIIRKVKKALGVAQNNQLVVCSDCFDAHKKRREKFEKTLMQYAAIGVIFFVLLLVLAPKLETFLFGLLIAGFMMLLSLVQYHPSTGTEHAKSK